MAGQFSSSFFISISSTHDINTSLAVIPINIIVLKNGWTKHNILKVCTGAWGFRWTGWLAFIAVVFGWTQKNMEKNNEYKKFEEDFLLLHKLLSCLKDAGVSIPAVRRQDQKHVVVSSYKHESSHLFLTSLIGIVNFGFDKYKHKGNGDIFWRNKLDLDIADLGEDALDYSIEQVSKAVDILEFNGDVTTDIPQKDNYPQNKNVVLTKQGFNAFASNKYLKLAKDERYSVDLHCSTMTTNNFAIGSGIAASIFALLAFWVSALQYCNQPKSITIEEIKQLKDSTLKELSKPESKNTGLIESSTTHPNSKTSLVKTNDSDSAKK